MGYSCDGYCDYDSQRIYVARELHPHRKNLTVTHEASHVILEYLGVPAELHDALIAKFEHPLLELINKFPEKYKDDK